MKFFYNSRTISTRIVAVMWWIFALIMISSYTANLVAFLTAVHIETPINNVEDLSKQTEIKYGAIKNGATASFFRKSHSPTYQRMWSFMESSEPSVFTDSNIEGFERVSEGFYLY